MKQYTVDDQMLSRGRQKMNILVTKLGIVEFTGKHIPPVLKVIKEDYSKNGKWSHSTYHIEVDESCEMVTWSQDFELGTYVTAKRWKEALQDFRNKINIDVTDEMIENFIRHRLEKAAEKLDNYEQIVAQQTSLEELMQNQSVFAEAQQKKSQAQATIQLANQMIEQVEQAQAEAEEAERQAETAKSVIETLKSGKSFNLADLKSALNK